MSYHGARIGGFRSFHEAQLLRGRGAEMGRSQRDAGQVHPFYLQADRMAMMSCGQYQPSALANAFAMRFLFDQDAFADPRRLGAMGAFMRHGGSAGVAAWAQSLRNSQAIQTVDAKHNALHLMAFAQSSQNAGLLEQHQALLAKHEQLLGKHEAVTNQHAEWIQKEEQRKAAEAKAKLEAEQARLFYESQP